MSEALRIDLADIGQERLSLEGCLSPGDLDLSEQGVLQTALLAWSVAIQRKGRGFRVTGKLNTELELECGRCLDPVSEPVQKEFELFFEQRENLVYSKGAEIELEESDTETSFLTGYQLALGEVIQEQVLLGLPMKPLCSAECRGLCPTCGINLNTDTCECAIGEISPVYETLQELKRQMERRSS